MAELVLVRIDSRMIHGQVTTRWNALVHATKIIVIDNEVAGNAIVASSLQFAAPQGVKALAYPVGQAAEAWKKNQFGDGRVMVLFRDAKSAYESWKEGFTYKKLNIGNIPISPGRTAVFKTCYMSQEEGAMLKELKDSGVEVELQFMPQEQKIPLERLLEKLNK